LDQLGELGLIHERGRQRTDSTHVLAAVRTLNRLERVGETRRAALNELAVLAPEWLQTLARPEWYPRYGRRLENYHLPKSVLPVRSTGGSAPRCSAGSRRGGRSGRR
jgi:transposase